MMITDINSHAYFGPKCTTQCVKFDPIIALAWLYSAILLIYNTFHLAF